MSNVDELSDYLKSLNLLEPSTCSGSASQNLEVLNNTDLKLNLNSDLLKENLSKIKETQKLIFSCLDLNLEEKEEENMAKFKTEYLNCDESLTVTHLN